MRIIHRWFVAVAVLFAAATAGVAQATPTNSSPRISKIDAQVTAALERSREMLARADRFVAKAARAGHGTPRWFARMNDARRLHRHAAKRLARFRRVAASPEVKARHDRARRETTARTTVVYTRLIEVYLAAGRKATARRLRDELRRIDAPAAARIRLDLPTAGRPGASVGGSQGEAPAAHPRTRAAKRPTGEEARWLERRGYRPAPRGGAASRRAPTSAGRAASPVRGLGRM